MAGWLTRMRHRIAELGEKDFTLPSLGAQFEPKEVQDAVARLARRLDAALPADFLGRVRARLAAEEQETVSDVHWNNLVFELKRYFVLAGLLRTAPMWSAAVDEIWHAMILHTREYEAFCRSFLGEMLHHSPNPDPEPDPAGRAFFDAVYVTLFLVTGFSQRTWGQFLRHPLDGALLQAAEKAPDSILSDRFSGRCGQDPDFGPLARAVVAHIADALQTVRAHAEQQGTSVGAFQQAFAPAGAPWANSGFLSQWLVFQSLFGGGMGLGGWGGLPFVGGVGQAACVAGGCAGAAGSACASTSCAGAGCGGGGCGTGF